jgi:hypothetical protein
MPPKGFMTPKQPGSPDYSPAGKVGSPTAEDLEGVKKNTPNRKNTTQKALREEFDKVGGRKRKSRKTKRKSKKSRRTRRRS